MWVPDMNNTQKTMYKIMCKRMNEGTRLIPEKLLNRYILNREMRCKIVWGTRIIITIFNLSLHTHTHTGIAQ